MTRPFTLLLGLVAIVTAVVLVRWGYAVQWTGFAASTSPSGNPVPAKSLWDWLDLLIVPAVLAIGAYLLDGSRKRSDRHIEADRQQQQALEHYFDIISKFLTDGRLVGENSTDLSRSLARTRTLTTLRLLDGERKAQLLQFLYESRLIHSPPTIRLTGADLNRANLNDATLAGAEIRGAYLRKSTFRNANLRGADLRGSDFENADFSGANLQTANFCQAILRSARFRGANLEGANFEETELESDSPTNPVK